MCSEGITRLEISTIQDLLGHLIIELQPLLNMMPINFKTKQVNKFKNPPLGEQSLIREFFEQKNDGFYVDVGANEPIVESQTWHLEKLGWKGLLIEPTPGYCEMLIKQRSGTVVQYACSSPENHDKQLKLIVANGGSTLNPELLLGKDAHSLESIEVTCKTLDSILENYHAPIGFYFMSIDIEGHEMEMFKGFTLSKWKPKLVLLEDHVINHQKHNHMMSNGYQLILRTGVNSWYVPVAENYKFSLSSKFEFLRKYWLGLPYRWIRYHRWHRF